MTKEKFLIFDTETTGLLPASQHRVHQYNTHQYPYIVQFSWMIYDNSVKRVTKIEDHVVRLPEGMEVPLESSKVHGITTKIMRKVGENILDVLKIFTKGSSIKLAVLMKFAFMSVELFLLCKSHFLQK